MKIKVKLIKTRHVSGYSMYGLTTSVRFNYREKIEGFGVVDSISYAYENQDYNYFITNKNIGGSPIFRRRSIDDIYVCEDCKGLVYYKGKFYIPISIKFVSNSSNGSNAFDTDRWETIYEVELKRAYLEELPTFPKSIRKKYKGDSFIIEWNNTLGNYVKK